MTRRLCDFTLSKEYSVFKSATHFYANGLLLLTRTRTHNQLQYVPFFLFHDVACFQYMHTGLNTFMFEAIAMIQLAILYIEPVKFRTNGMEHNQIVIIIIIW